MENQDIKIKVIGEIVSQEKSEEKLLANPGETLCLCEQTLSVKDRSGLQTIAEWPFRWRLSKHWMVPI